MSCKKILVGSLALSALLLFITDSSTHFLHGGIFYNLEVPLLEPLFFISLAIVISTAILLFFSERIFKLWLRKFMIWFVPAAVLLIATGSVTVSYGWPTRTSFAILSGEIMVVVTLLLALIQRFYYKVK